MRHGGQSPARSIGLAILICVYAVATVLMGTLNPFPFFFACYAFGDYVFFLIYYRRLLGLSAPAFRRSARWIAGVTPVACLALLLAFLQSCADTEVRDNPVLQAGFVIAWGAAMIWTHLTGSLIGLNILEHGVEGRNPAAIWAGVGLTFGATLATAGANIGQGPTEATTLGPMFLAVGGLITLWAAFSILTRSVAAVTVGRDLNSLS